MTITEELPVLAERVEAASVAQATHDFLKSHPTRLRQVTWQGKDECGTVACVAGWVGILYDDPHTSLDVLRETMALSGQDLSAMSRHQYEWERRQALRLGLDGCAATILFNRATDDVVRPMLTDIAEWHREHPHRTEPMLWDEVAAIHARACKAANDRSASTS